jgi:type I restriction enzyme S subunit
MSFKERNYIDAQSFCIKVTDGTHDSPKSKEFGKHLITSKHIKGRNIDFNNAYLISEEDYNKINQRSNVDQWDVLISMIGEYCGFCYIERNHTINYAVKNVGIFKTGSKAKAYWIYYYLNSPEGKNSLSSLKSGTSQPYISLGSLRTLPILIPNNIEEMEAINDILSTLDDKIDLNNRMNNVLEQMAQAIFKQWFVDFEFPNENVEPYKSSGGEMEWCEELGKEIPLGWSVGCLGDIASISSGKRPNSKSEAKSNEYLIPLLGASSVMGYVNDVLYNEPILVIGRVGTHGVIQRYKTQCWASDNTLVIKSVLFEYTYQILRNIDYKALNRGSTQPLITQTDVKQTKVLLPVKEIINIFERIVGDMFKLIERNIKEIDILLKTRDTLLPKLMSGEINVSEIEL